ncbi:MAG: hypothetical protein QOE05_3121 [Actinomycetota bacterium]|nr:hypothetical protein [Actinomycetota bacterium]
MLAVLAIVVMGFLLAAYAGTGPKQALDPAAYTPDGAHAIAALLEDRGVVVRRVETVEATVAGGTVFVPVADAFTADELKKLVAAEGRLVVVGATGDRLEALAGGVSDGPAVDVETRRPSCSLPAAVRAGDAEIGGPSYRSTQDATECYAASGWATLLQHDAITLLGSPDLFTNARLAKRGNAALALGLLGAEPEVQWLLPRPGARAVDSDKSLNDLIPTALKLAVLQLLVALGILGLFRARRLGPVVTEPLPVIVRAAEAVEGRSRLYRASRSRATAAEALRAGARDRLARRLGLGPDTGSQALVAAVVAHTSGNPSRVDALLYGAAPTGDDALVELADDLDLLILEVAGS